MRNKILKQRIFKDPFVLEYRRQEIAAENDLNQLKRLYSTLYPTIKDNNSSIFWNEKFSKVLSLSEQDGMTKDRVKAVVEFIPNKKLNILDIGAGMGFVEEILSKNKKYYLNGNDFSDISIKRLTGKFKGDFRKMSLYKMKYPNKSFDVVLALEVLEHIPPRKIFRVLNKINRILKKEGLFILSVPMNEGLDKLYPNNPNSHLRMYTPSLIKAELEISGFEILNEKTFFAFNKYYMLKKMLSKILIKKWKPNNIVIKAVKK